MTGFVNEIHFVGAAWPTFNSYAKMNMIYLKIYTSNVGWKQEVGIIN